ncbi:hypothetical protein CLU81_1250 [Flavobacterium sp. 9]|uniref:hypothetical protein n=1 Tax=Flavobacterium sp. 9 TaxID=2035198 RepID=UPI000C1A7853|nr:hypothetical protein [Flavobacterium sp. 9]PIF30800.1 hypothetical protein CLU81_1250 [Flavobacterium sp. 9]
MPNNTFEDYKIAVKSKYDEVKNGEHFVYLNSPTRGKLRSLCWELFLQENRNQDDLNVFSSLLELAFDVTKKNKFDQQIDKFRPIETYFKGETDPANVDAVNLAAILVDFKARPFNKFRIQNLYKDEIEIDDTNRSEVLNTERQQIDSSEILENFLDKKESEKRIEKGIITQKVNEEVKQNTIEEAKPKPNAISAFLSFKENPSSRLKGKIRNTSIATLLIFGLIITVIYFAFFKNDCMQWSEDHYEIVDCSSKVEGNLNEVIPLNKELLDFRKLTACDTTNCFKKDGEAFIWYTKTPDGGIDFFNDHGRHPEFNRPLRPVSHYIFNKYIKGKPCK